MKKSMKIIAAAAALVTVFSGNIFCIPSYETAVSSENCISVSAEENILPMPSNNLSSYKINQSFITAEDNGFMRLFHSDDKIFIEYYDDSFNITSRKSIDMELSIWGGFYSGSDAYYLIEGENNTAEDTSAEVIRVIKYDKDWNRLGAAKIIGKDIFAHQVRYPFDYGCVKATEYNGKLYIVTGHEGYVDENFGQGHQGFLMIAVDETTMEGEIVNADLWHSFYQYIANDGSDIYVLEQSEGSRYTKLSHYNADTLDSESIPVLEYGGSRDSAWAISCYATVDEIALSAENILCIGTSIDQSDYDNYSSDTPYNIYLTVTPKSNFSEEATEVKWITDYVGNGARFSGLNMTRINDNRFLVSWQESSSGEEVVADENDVLSDNIMHYIFIDGSGNKISDEFTANAPISDCEPILKGSRLVYYASNENTVNFYSIDAETGEFSKNMYHIIGENVEWKIENGTLTISGTGDMMSMSGDSSWYAVKDKIEKIVIEDGITNIPDNAFVYLSNLKEVVMADSVKSIGANAFENCLSLEEIVVGNGVEKIGEEAFSYCENLKKVTIPASVTEIGADIVWTGYFWIGSGGHVYDATIYAPEGSYAQQYAEENGIYFEPLVSDDKLTGDINSDGDVNIADLVLLKRYILSETESIDLQADLNSDSNIDIFDFSILKNMLIGLE